jgi:signal recognition particle GTPase
MTSKRLEELSKKFEDGNGTTKDLGEIVSEMFKSFSEHLKDLKNQVGRLEINQEIIFESIDDIKNLMNPVYSIVVMDEEEFSYDDEENSSLD